MSAVCSYYRTWTILEGGTLVAALTDELDYRQPPLFFVVVGAAPKGDQVQRCCYRYVGSVKRDDPMLGVSFFASTSEGTTRVFAVKCVTERDVRHYN